MNETENNRKDPVAQCVILWPRGLRHEPDLFPLGATDEETEAIRRILKRTMSRYSKIEGL